MTRALCLLALAALLAGCCGSLLPAHRWQGTVSHPAPEGYWPGVVVSTCSEVANANWGGGVWGGKKYCRIKVRLARHPWPRTYGIDCASHLDAGALVWAPNGAGTPLPRRPGEAAPEGVR